MTGLSNVKCKTACTYTLHQRDQGQWLGCHTRLVQEDDREIDVFQRIGASGGKARRADLQVSLLRLPLARSTTHNIRIHQDVREYCGAFHLQLLFEITV